MVGEAALPATGETDPFVTTWLSSVAGTGQVVAVTRVLGDFRGVGPDGEVTHRAAGDAGAQRQKVAAVDRGCRYP